VKDKSESGLRLGSSQKFGVPFCISEMPETSKFGTQLGFATKMAFSEPHTYYIETTVK